MGRTARTRHPKSRTSPRAQPWGRWPASPARRTEGEPATKAQTPAPPRAAHGSQTHTREPPPGAAMGEVAGEPCSTDGGGTGNKCPNTHHHREQPTGTRPTSRTSPRAQPWGRWPASPARRTEGEPATKPQTPITTATATRNQTPDTRATPLPWPPRRPAVPSPLPGGLRRTAARVLPPTPGRGDFCSRSARVPATSAATSSRRLGGFGCPRRGGFTGSPTRTTIAADRVSRLRRP